MKDSLFLKDVVIRDATEEDAPGILSVYSYYVEQTAITFEYEVPSEEEFRERIRHTLEKYPYLVAEKNGRIVGYAYAGSFVGRAAYDWSAELTIYLDHTCEKKGLGRLLYEALEKELADMGVLNLYACIGYPESEDNHLNFNSAQFHEHLGFHLVGTFHQCGYKFDTWYHMIWMEKIIGEHHTGQSPVRFKSTRV